MPVLGSFLSHTGGRHGYHSLFSSSSSLPYGRYGGGGLRWFHKTSGRVTLSGSLDISKAMCERGGKGLVPCLGRCARPTWETARPQPLALGLRVGTHRNASFLRGN